MILSDSADFEVQGAHRLAKQFDPDGKRTIGEENSMCVIRSYLYQLFFCRCSHKGRPYTYR